MKLLYWNIHGIGNLDSRLVLKRFCITQKPDMVFISKPWIFPDQFPVAFWKSIGLKPFVVNNRNTLKPSIWGICADHLDLIVIANSAQQISLSIIYESQTIYVSTIYASINHTTRRQLWMELATLQRDFPGPWLFVGDYNSVLGAHEKREAIFHLR